MYMVWEFRNYYVHISIYEALFIYLNVIYIYKFDLVCFTDSFIKLLTDFQRLLFNVLYYILIQYSWL